jgi:alkylated DNA repair protein alkB family protein 6
MDEFFSLEYAPGQGIMPHEDGPNYFPFVAILSTQANARMTFQPHREYEKSGTHETFAFQVERRSLLLFTEKAYTEYLHSIDQVMDAKRISLTIRLVRNGLISNQNDV